MTSLPATLVDALATRWGTAPALTWYGADGERVELSGRVLANWVTKAANLLIEEADAGPGTWVHIDLPVHWRAVAWTAGAWLAGCQVVLDEPGGDETGTAGSDVVVTARPDDARVGADLVLAVALPALAMQWDGPPLPPGVVDAAAELMSYGDRLGYAQRPTDHDVALAGSRSVRYGELAAWSSTGRELPDGARVVVTPASLRELLAQTLAVWQRGGSVVLLEAGRTDGERVAAQELATLL